MSRAVYRWNHALQCATRKDINLAGWNSLLVCISHSFLMTTALCGYICTSSDFISLLTECYCDNSISNLSKPIVGSDPSATGCDYICQANTTEYCGGAERVSIYKKMS